MYYSRNAEFPDFKLISQEDSEFISNFTKKYLPYSDFNFLSMFSWNTDKTNAFSFLNNNLVIRVKSYVGDGYLYSILGENVLDNSLSTLLSQLKVLHAVPEIVVQKVNMKKFAITEDRDSFDYVLSVRDLSELNGHAYKNVRKHINYFNKNYPDVSSTLLNLELESDVALVLELVKKWCAFKDFTKTETNQEVENIKKFISLSSSYAILAIGLYFERKLIAFSLNELLDDSWAMGHFGKADNTYEHAALTMEHMTARYLLEKGFEWINIQQDTGLPGLRNAKLALKPASFLKKYKVSSL